MTKLEALEYLQLSPLNRVRHSYYSSEEWLSFKEGQFVTEDGYSHGSIYDEFWTIYQKWESGWEKVKDTKSEDYSTTEISNGGNTYDVIPKQCDDEKYDYEVKSNRMSYSYETNAQINSHWLPKNSHKRTNKRNKRK